MLKTLLRHEILSLLKSKRIYWTVVMFLLLFASVFIYRVIDFQKQINQYIIDVATTEEDTQKFNNYSGIYTRAIQQPIIFSIYNQGLQIPRVIDIDLYNPITSTRTMNEEVNLVFYEDIKLDITFLVTFFLSLFILLISYDSVNGEKQVGTLRILLTYPLKRQSFILKKILGVFIFVSFTFTIPYVLSLLSLVIIYANLLTLNFFLSAFFYWFLVMLFIFFFCLLGIFISICSASPNRSLVYALMIWIMLSIILPISWDYILSPYLYNDTLVKLNQNYLDKTVQLRRIIGEDLPEESKYPSEDVFKLMGPGNVRSTGLYGWDEAYEKQYRYQRYLYDKYYHLSRETEQVRDEYYRKQGRIDNVRNWLFFYNPIVLFESIGAKITGNSREDMIKFLHSSRDIRDQIMNQGATEGWLFDFRYIAIHREEDNPGSKEAIIAKYGDFYDNDEFDSLWAYVRSKLDNAQDYEMIPLVLPKYNQPVFTFGEIFSRIVIFLCLFIISIIFLWIITWYRFMRYDVR